MFNAQTLDEYFELLLCMM